MEKNELQLAQNVVDAMNQIGSAPGVWFSPYFAHIKRDITSHYWNDVIAQTCLSFGKQAAELINGLSPDDPRMAEFSAIVDQVTNGYSAEAFAKGVRPIIGGVCVWAEQSLTQENVDKMVDYLSKAVA